ncbi:MAG: sugar phosphate isomerase/epimerase [Gemmatimonadetes bacterium]|jgi:3-dehydroshikimate dehydratase|nr:sugar phosphate isomerase/epimerase [Gemmatimonadota bacterium]MBT6147077.1 sugar phosphate isomerase/epimerase [Gemmatimonadota bacterium]MBT7863581.1 sugar phosphate isomerase/epimerase [Gemmatimonadota bacterium]
MATFTITGFADEIAPAMDEQVAGLQATQVAWVEVRGVDGTGVLDLTDTQAEQLRRRLVDAGIGVSSVGSPIGKVDIADDLEAHFEQFQIALRRAEQLGCDYVRIFSFYHKDQAAAAIRGLVMEQMHRMTQAAVEAGVTLLHENEKGIYGESPEHCLDLLATVNSPHLRAAFDPANFIQCGHAAKAGFDLLVEHVAYFHIKDAVAATGRVVPAGHGDGALEQILRAAVERGFSGFASIEPHLKADDPDFGGSGAERFATAVAALRSLLDRVER